MEGCSCVWEMAKKLLINAMRRTGVLFPFDSYLAPHPLFLSCCSRVQLTLGGTKNRADIYLLHGTIGRFSLGESL